MFMDHHQRPIEDGLGDGDSEAFRAAMKAQLKKRLKLVES